MSPITIKDDQTATLKIAPTDAAGNPRTPDAGSVVWSVSSPLVTLAPSADGMSCVVTPKEPGGLGSANVSVNAKFDGGAETLGDAVSVTVVADVPASLGLQQA